MASVQPTLMPNDIAERKTGRPRIYTNEEIKEQRKVQMRQYLNKKKETKVNKPKSSVIGRPHIYTNEEAKQQKEKVSRDIIRKTGSAESAVKEMSTPWHG